MADEKRPVNVTIKCKHGGFAFDLQAECYVDHIPGLVNKLLAVGVEPANSPYLWSDQGKGNSTSATGGTPVGNVPICPVHHVPMKQGRNNPNAWYCSRKDENGYYCEEKAYT